MKIAKCKTSTSGSVVRSSNRVGCELNGYYSDTISSKPNNEFLQLNQSYVSIYKYCITLEEGLLPILLGKF